MAERVTFRIVDIRCPICGSDNCRSKVHDGERWWYVCDNPEDHGLLILPDGEEIEFPPRWYFIEDGSIIEVNGKQYKLEGVSES